MLLEGDSPPESQTETGLTLESPCICLLLSLGLHPVHFEKHLAQHAAASLHHRLITALEVIKRVDFLPHAVFIDKAKHSGFDLIKPENLFATCLLYLTCALWPTPNKILRGFFFLQWFLF